MTVNDPTDSEAGPTDDAQHAPARKNRGIRFSDPEWEEVKQAAQTSGITPAEFVRDTILDIIRNPDAPETTPFRPASHRWSNERSATPTCSQPGCATR